MAETITVWIVHSLRSETCGTVYQMIFNSLLLRMNFSNVLSQPWCLCLKGILKLHFHTLCMLFSICIMCRHWSVLTYISQCGWVLINISFAQQMFILLISLNYYIIIENVVSERVVALKVYISTLLFGMTWTISCFHFQIVFSYISLTCLKSCYLIIIMAILPSYHLVVLTFQRYEYSKNKKVN